MEAKFSVQNHIENVITLIFKWYLNRTRVEPLNTSFTHVFANIKSKLKIYIVNYSVNNSIRGTVSELKLS